MSIQFIKKHNDRDTDQDKPTVTVKNIDYCTNNFEGVW